MRLGLRCVLHLQWGLRGNNQHQQHLLLRQPQSGRLALPLLCLQGLQRGLSDQAQLRHLRHPGAEQRRQHADLQHGLAGRPEDPVLGGSVQVGRLVFRQDGEVEHFTVT